MFPIRIQFPKFLLAAWGVLSCLAALPRLSAVEENRFLDVRLDKGKSFVILATEAAAREYRDAVLLARNLHPGAAVATFDPGDMQPLKKLFDGIKPYYVLVFIKPGELDANFAWQWLNIAAAVDDDPFVDIHTGFVTGDTPAAASAFVQRICDAVAGRLKLPAAFIDNLGPNETAGKGTFFKMPGSFMVPVLARQWPVYTLSFGREGFTTTRLAEMSGAGIVHFGGHGYPDRIIDCLNGPFARRLPVSPCLVFNGACYTGVTGNWYDISSGRVKGERVQSRYSFCLGILTGRVIAYLAALHADHGLPVYQELEYWVFSGASLGKVIAHTHDGVMLAGSGQKPDWQPLHPGEVFTSTPDEFMRRGTASRVLFGDPSLIVGHAFTDPPFEVTMQHAGAAGLRITATLKNQGLLSTYADTYYSDLSRTGQFNDRALVSCPLPRDWHRVSGVVVAEMTAAGKPLTHRLVGYAVEKGVGRDILWVQVDTLSTGYLQSPFRSPGTRLVLSVHR